MLPELSDPTAGLGELILRRDLHAPGVYCPQCRARKIDFVLKFTCSRRRFQFFPQRAFRRSLEIASVAQHFPGLSQVNALKYDLKTIV